MGKQLTTILLGVAFLLSPLKANSWGRIGHESIAEIANDNLDPSVKTKIKTILGKASLANAAVWPDQIKRNPQWQQTRTYHYTEVPAGKSYWSEIKKLTDKEAAQGDVLRALIKSELILRDTDSSKEQKKWALAFLVHFIGDIHQPLHTGKKEDRGGNGVDVSFFGVKTNLHSVWDVGIINAFLELGVSHQAEGSDTKEFINTLRTPSENEISKWQSSYMSTWLNESVESRSDAYAFAPLTNKSYQKKNQTIISESILKAGYRLSGLLNAIFNEEEYGGYEAEEVVKNFKSALGKKAFSDIILEPNTSAVDQNDLVSDVLGQCDHEETAEGYDPHF